MENIPQELMNTPIKDWQINLVTVFVVSQIVGRVWAGLRSNGGIKGVLAGIWLGTNTPPEKK